MQWRNSRVGYGWVSVVFHWGLAIALLALFALGIWMVTLDYYSPWYHQAPNIHKSIGVLLVSFMLLRWGWHVWSPTPKTFERMTATQSQWIHLSHQFFYWLVVALGMSGYLISTAEGASISVFEWFDIPAWFEPFENQADLAGEIHRWLAYGLISLVFIHASGALIHHFYFKDRTLKRMFGQ